MTLSGTLPPAEIVGLLNAAFIQMTGCVNNRAISWHGARLSPPP